MILDISNMFNFQLICNDSSMVGRIHSYNKDIMTSEFFANHLIVDRRRIKNGRIIRAQIVEV